MVVRGYSNCITAVPYVTHVNACQINWPTKAIICENSENTSINLTQ